MMMMLDEKQSLYAAPQKRVRVLDAKDPGHCGVGGSLTDNARDVDRGRIAQKRCKQQDTDNHLPLNSLSYFS